MEWEMARVQKYSLVGAEALIMATNAWAGVGITLSPNTPDTTGDNQFNLDNSGSPVQQDYTDNGHNSAGGYGAPGESFTTPTDSSAGFTLSSISVEVNL